MAIEEITGMSIDEELDAFEQTMKDIDETLKSYEFKF